MMDLTQACASALQSFVVVHETIYRDNPQKEDKTFLRSLGTFFFVIADEETDP
jgi:hypothetical protein